MQGTLTLTDFAELFGAEKADFSEACQQLIEETDFRYRLLAEREKEDAILEVLKRIDSGQLSVSGEARHGDWETGWGENLSRFTDSNFDLSQLVPAYIRPVEIDRLNQQYVQSTQPKFQLNYYTIFRQYLFNRYFKEVDHVYEFGCGTGYNLVIMAQMFPDKQFFGLDWAQTSVQLVNTIADTHQLPIQGHHFDMFNPNPKINIKPNSAILTLNALEQLGQNHEAFIQFVLSQKPVICVNSEPLVELYDENNLLDYLAIKYHRKRGYLDGYLTRLRELEKEKNLEILKTQRIPFGNMFHEGYSLVIWKGKA